MPDTVVEHLTRPFSLRLPWPGQEFALLLVVKASDVTLEEQARLSREIVDAGCRYAVCMGVGSGTWDDSIDYAVVEAEIEGRRPQSTTVMTTWHDTKGLEEVVQFFLRHTAFEDFTSERRLAIQLGGAKEDLLKLQAVVKESSSGRTTGIWTPPVKRES
jgi:hypothetical protein